MVPYNFVSHCFSHSIYFSAVLWLLAINLIALRIKVGIPAKSHQWSLFYIQYIRTFKTTHTSTRDLSFIGAIDVINKQKLHFTSTDTQKKSIQTWTYHTIWKPLNLLQRWWQSISTFKRTFTTVNVQNNSSTYFACMAHWSISQSVHRFIIRRQDFVTMTTTLWQADNQVHGVIFTSNKLI